MKYCLKYLIFSLPFLTSMHQVLSEQPFCSIANMKINPSLLDKLKEKFITEMDAHYSHLVSSGSISQREKVQALKKYENPSIIVCPNPQDPLQKVVYIEYEKNWWGNLYFVILENNKIFQWSAINTHGAITTHVRWNEDSFFYEDSTHSGTKTQNICHVKQGSILCQRFKKP